jgi:7-keto-8-aminopelargonate synthetase-like enzyme
VIAAVQKYGTQFPFAKPQLECALYGELESALEAMTGGRVIVASSATLTHLAAIPALMSTNDAVVMDRLAHASLYTATALLKDVELESVPHARMDVLADRLAQLSKTHERVWYIMDGVYSMSGDFAPIAAVGQLLHDFPKLHVYADDAHCTSWTGLHGRGFTLQQLTDKRRVVVTHSLNKAFSAGGAALVFHDEALRNRVRHAGAALMFSGPLQPPMLGAAVASAKLHLTQEFDGLQRRLSEQIDTLHALADHHDIQLASKDRTPIAFIPCGSDRAMYALFHALEQRGFFVAPAVFPAVPQDRAGLRLTVSLHNSARDTERLMAALDEELHRLPEVVAYQRKLAASPQRRAA